MRNKRVIAYVAAFGVAIAALTGCGSNTTETAATTQAQNSTTEAAATANCRWS